MLLIQFIKELYLTAFVVIYRNSRAKDVGYKVGAAVGVLALVQSFILMGIEFGIEMLLRRKLLTLSTHETLAIFLTIIFLNAYILYFRRHGIEFVDKFDKFDKARKKLLIIGFIVFMLASIAFGVCMGIAYRHFFGIK